jgi:hypothetical protein
LKEKHNDGLAGHFEQDKTFSLLNAYYFWSGTQVDVKRFVEKCRICQHAKEKGQNIGLY